MKYVHVLLWTACMRFSKNEILPLSVRKRLDTMQAPAFITAVFPNCLCRLPSSFFIRTRVNLRDMIVYSDIKIYCSNVKTLCFLEKLSSASTTHFALQLGNQATDRFYFFFCCTITHWYTDFRSYLDFHKMHKCRVFTQQVTYTYVC